MHRFFVDPSFIDGDDAVFPPQISRQIARVLRMRRGDRVVALDDSGGIERVVELGDIHPARVRGSVVDSRAGRGEPSVELCLYPALIEPSRFEFALQKGTELGVARFAPVVTRRSLPKDARVSDTRRARWLRIIREAAEQCGRSRLPTLAHPASFVDALSSAPRPALMAWEREESASVSDALKSASGGGAPITAASAFVGPVGGFEPMEAELARAKGVATFGLGSRVLRAETASVVVVALMMNALGELSPR